jgi:NADH-quinone oxidoreductase subunit G
VATIYIDNKPYEVKNGQNLLAACLSLGFNVPYYCWHPALNSVGACRMCAIKQFKDENDTRGKIVMSCMTPAADGTRISIEDKQVRDFRRAVSEWLMTNHPHDCPVCDEGGECHLQDMTHMTGQVYRRFRFKKRTYSNQDLGPYVTHEMNRCIQCYRCVRFYRDYAGGRDLQTFAWHNHVYFGRDKDGPLENEFSGNLIEICPTGVFDDKPFSRHYTRKWDLQTAPSICTHCGLGCNIIAGERYGTLRRIRNRYHHQVNGYFLCDRGRFGFEFVNSADRLTQPQVFTNGRLESTSVESTLKQIAPLFREHPGVIGIGSPTASLEANFALRTLVGPENFYYGISDGQAELLETVLPILADGSVPAASILDAHQADAVLVLGEDLFEIAPRLGLAVRLSVRNSPMEIARKLRIDEWNAAAVSEAVQDRKGPLFIFSPGPTDLDEIATIAHRCGNDETLGLARAVIYQLDSSRPGVNSISTETAKFAKNIADALANANRPLVVTGVSSGRKSLLLAAAAITHILKSRQKNVRICFTVPHCNSLGLAMLAPKHISAAIGALESGKASSIIIIENALNKILGADIADKLLRAARQRITIEYLRDNVPSNVDFVLPAATFAESQGTFINNETRAQRFFKVFAPRNSTRETWRWLREIAVAAGIDEMADWHTFDDLIAALTKALPQFEPLARIAPDASFRICGQKIARQHYRYSGRTTMSAQIDVNEPEPPQDSDSPLTYTMEGFQGRPPSSLIQRYWNPGWNSVQALNKFQHEIGGELRGGDPGFRLIEPTGRGASKFLVYPEGRE